MATPASRMMLFKNGKSFPLNLFCGSLLGGSNNIPLTAQLISDPALLQPQQKPIFNVLGDQSNVGLGCDINRAFNWRFGGFGEMGRMEAGGKKKKTVNRDDDGDDDDDYGDNDGEDFVADDVKEMEAFRRSFFNDDGRIDFSSDDDDDDFPKKKFGKRNYSNPGNFAQGS